MNGELHYLADVENKLADVENKVAGSVTKAYKFMSITIGSDPFFDAAAECQY